MGGMTNTNRPALAIDTSGIPRADLAIELAGASNDPDGQQFPWRPSYPLVGQSVLHLGKLWTVSGPSDRFDADHLRLIGCGHTGDCHARRSELRPVTWTQYLEDSLSRQHSDAQCRDHGCARWRCDASH